MPSYVHGVRIQTAGLSVAMNSAVMRPCPPLRFWQMSVTPFFSSGSVYFTNASSIRRLLFMRMMDLPGGGSVRKDENVVEAENDIGRRCAGRPSGCREIAGRPFGMISTNNSAFPGGISNVVGYAA